MVLQIGFQSNARQHHRPAWSTDLFRSWQQNWVLQRRVQDPPALQILQGQVVDGDHVVVDRRGEELVFSVTMPAEAIFT